MDEMKVRRKLCIDHGEAIESIYLFISMFLNARLFELSNSEVQMSTEAILGQIYAIKRNLILGFVLNHRSESVDKCWVNKCKQFNFCYLKWIESETLFRSF